MALGAQATNAPSLLPSGQVRPSCRPFLLDERCMARLPAIPSPPPPPLLPTSPCLSCLFLVSFCSSALSLAIFFASDPLIHPLFTVFALQDNHIRFELNHAELRAMLDQMERIQEQLDALA